ncbi:hypothetical protein TRICI_004441 [Trichomonascus ciferrii]|uniref:LIM zinc-binding domain-containing protein n=1 Tax=Trichomonascus ciferrii TaxID=44093 RepID=A0A642V0V5_9ASCO|nr:hypothetical protein TRICI_004441 [Trichomonascus ciferrii]
MLDGYSTCIHLQEWCWTCLDPPTQWPPCYLMKMDGGGGGFGACAASAGFDFEQQPPSTPRFDFHVPSSQTSPRTSFSSASGKNHRLGHHRKTSSLTGGPPPNVLTPPMPPPEYTFEADYYSTYNQPPLPPSPTPPEPKPRRRNLPAPTPPAKRISNNECCICASRLYSNERVVRTDYGTIHTECFRCHACDQSLEHTQFYFNNETQKIYCHLDYHQLFSPPCGYCGTPVESNGIFALDKHWHKGHFFCADCSEPFSETDNYYRKDGDTLCEKCHSEKLAIKCWKCSYKCSPAIEALGRTWCSSCFCCEECTTQFADHEFILRQDGTLVCHSCEARRIKEECWS